MSPYGSILSQHYVGAGEYEWGDDVMRHHIVVLAIFDHDWQQHVLVQQCSTGPVADAMGMNRWEYAFYFVQGIRKRGAEFIHVRTFFDAERAPFVEAAQMVECWTQHGHYGGTLNSVESDMFD